ncbi:MAG: ABC transporter substrate-binding protein [Bacillota bacterium]|nr:ABC transporter substrate-binding protein [Bacillota bacterium]
MKRRLLGLMGVTMVVLLLAGCAGGKQPAEQQKPTQEFVIANVTDVVQFDPVKIGDAPSSFVASFIYEQLVRREFDGKFVPSLAEKWDVSPDGTVWTFHLRKGVKFHDGSDFNADVVIWHFQRAMGEGSNFKKQFSTIKEMKAPDAYTVQFTLSGPNAAFLDVVVTTNGGYIPSKKAFETLGDKFAREPVGTGPFKYQEWVPGQRFVMVANDGYWGGRPRLDRVVVRVIPEANTQVVELETGGVHYISRAPKQDLERLSKNPAVKIHSGPGYMIRYLSFNTRAKPLDDIRVRKAINHALDVTTVVKTLGVPMCTPADSIVPLASWAYPGSDKLTHYPYDPEKAKQFLAEAGWKPGADGVLRKGGQPLKLTIDSPDGRYFMDKEMCEAFKNQLAKVGIQAEIKVMEWGAFLEEVRGGKYQVAFLGWNQSSGEPSLFFDPLVKTGGRGNYGGFSNAELDRLLDQGLATTDQPRRTEIYVKAAQIVNDQAWFVFLSNESEMVITSARVKGYRWSVPREDFTQITIEK